MLATADATQTQGRRRTYSSEPWGFEEISTRNCGHCHSDRLAFLVVCDKGISLTHNKRPYFYNYIVSKTILADPCKNCKDFDNSWDAP